MKQLGSCGNGGTGRNGRTRDDEDVLSGCGGQRSCGLEEVEDGGLGGAVMLVTWGFETGFGFEADDGCYMPICHGNDSVRSTFLIGGRRHPSQSCSIEI